VIAPPSKPIGPSISVPESQLGAPGSTSKSRALLICPLPIHLLHEGPAAARWGVPSAPQRRGHGHRALHDNDWVRAAYPAHNTTLRPRSSHLIPSWPSTSGSPPPKNSPVAHWASRAKHTVNEDAQQAAHHWPHGPVACQCCFTCPARRDDCELRPIRMFFIRVGTSSVSTRTASLQNNSPDGKELQRDKSYHPTQTHCGRHHQPVKRSTATPPALLSSQLHKELTHIAGQVEFSSYSKMNEQADRHWSSSLSHLHFILPLTKPLPGLLHRMSPELALVAQSLNPSQGLARSEQSCAGHLHIMATMLNPAPSCQPGPAGSTPSSRFPCHCQHKGSQG